MFFERRSMNHPCRHLLSRERQEDMMLTARVTAIDGCLTPSFSNKAQEKILKLMQ
jgi:hypothetical protein